MKILITGIQGFVGSNIVESMRENHTIYGLDIINTTMSGVVHIYSWNNLSLLPDVDVVIHLAGKAHDLKNKSLSDEYFDINTGLTQKIYDWFLKSSATKFIFFSSVKAVADKVEGKMLTEDVDPNPVGPYGESKRSAEIYILNQPLDANVKRAYILRPSMIHGKGNKGNLNLLLSVVKWGFPWPLGAFENKRSFTSIDNLIFIINNLIEKDVECGIYNIADDEAISTNELIAVIADGLSKRIRIIKINQAILRFFATIGSFFHLPFNLERLKKLTESYIVSNQKIKKALNIEKMPVNTVEGLSKTIRSFVK